MLRVCFSSIAICPVARPWEALLIGAVGALLACPGCALLNWLRIDDPVGCVPTHCFAGIWGLLSVSLFAERDLENGFSNKYGIFKGGPWHFLGVQMLTAVAVAAWAAITTFLELLLVDKICGLRVSIEDELSGADKVEHGIVEHEMILEGNYGTKMSDCGQIQSVDIDVDRLQANEEANAINREETFWQTARTQQRKPQPKWRQSVSVWF